MDKKIVINPSIDFFLIKFPIWIPIIFYYFINNFNSYYTFILLGYLLIGEIHFGSTFVFFLDKNYRKLFINEKYTFLIWPILIIIFCVFFSYFFSISSILFIILLFNFYHVNRQSAGIIKLFKSKFENVNYSIFFLYVISFSLCFLGLLKYVFKSKFYFENSKIFPILFFLITIFSIFFIYLENRKNFNLTQIFNFLTGVLIFFPILICEKIIDVFAMGVGMHYVQYIALTWAIFYRKSKNTKLNEDKIFQKFSTLKNIIIYLLCYSLLMLFFSNLNINYKNEQVGLYLIPIFFQLMHFYIDMFIWKFSTPHVRENIGPYIFSK